MTELEAYLQQLKLKWDNMSNAGGGVPIAYRNQSAHRGSSVSAPYQAYTPATDNSIQGYYASHQDNPKDELFGKYAPGL